MQRIAALVLAGMLTACVPYVRPDPGLPDVPGNCCTPLRAQSDANVAAFDRAAPTLLPVLRGLAWRDGFLTHHPAAVARIAGQAQPLDLVVLSFKHHLAGNLSQGYLNHVALWLGHEDQLRALGIWDDPAVQPLQAQIRAGAVLIEANGVPVALTTPAQAMNADAVVLLRPQGLNRADRQQALRRLAGLHGLPFDAHFRIESPDCVYCTELADRAMPGLNLPRQDYYGRPVILPDAIVTATLAGRIPLGFVDFIAADRQGWQPGDADLLGRTLAANWPARPGVPHD